MKRLFILICTFGLLLFVARTTMAQEATQEATLESAPVTIVGDATLTFETDQPVTEPDEPMPWLARAGVILTVVGTAAYTVLQAMREFIKGLRDLVYGIAHHPVIVTLLERAFNSAPESTQNAVKGESGAILDEVRGLVDEIRKLRDEVVDKTPYALKTDTPSQDSM